MPPINKIEPNILHDLDGLNPNKIPKKTIKKVSSEKIIKIYSVGLLFIFSMILSIILAMDQPPAE